MRQWILSTVCGLLAGVAFSFPAHVSTGSLDIASAGSASWNAFSFKWNNRRIVQQFSVTFTNSLNERHFCRRHQCSVSIELSRSRSLLSDDCKRDTDKDRFVTCVRAPDGVANH